MYNAINGTTYSLEELEITTLEMAIYMGVKNDASLIVGSEMSLWEHQSSFNPNMPLRGLVYFGESMDMEEAVDKAVEQCIKEGVMEAFLREHRAEVRGMMLTDYDEKKTLEHFKKEWYEDGWNDGQAAGMAKGWADGQAAGIAKGWADGQAESFFVLVKNLQLINPGMSSEEANRQAEKLLRKVE